MLIDHPEDREPVRGDLEEGLANLPPADAAKNVSKPLELGEYIFPGSRSRSIRPGTAPRSAYIEDLLAEGKNPHRLLEQNVDNETAAVWAAKYPEAFDPMDPANVPDVARGESYPEAFNPTHPLNLVTELKAALGSMGAATQAEVDAILEALVGPSPEDALSQPEEERIPVSQIAGIFAAHRGARSMHTMDPSDTATDRRTDAKLEIYQKGFDAVQFMNDELRRGRDARNAAEASN